MINRNELIMAVDIISESIVKIAEKAIDGRINEEISFEYNSIVEYLSPYEGLAVSKLLIDQYKLNDQEFINSDIIRLPIKYLACYILLNGGLG